MRIQTLESIFKADGKDMIVLPFKSYLLNLMDLYQEDRDHIDQIPGYLNYLDACTKQGYGYTVLDKGKPIVCFGIVPQWPGVAELWLIPDKNLIQSKMETKIS
jgi:hypothetical protein